jgi:hypothetical protein
MSENGQPEEYLLISMEEIKKADPPPRGFFEHVGTLAGTELWCLHGCPAQDCYALVGVFSAGFFGMRHDREKGEVTLALYLKDGLEKKRLRPLVSYIRTVFGTDCIRVQSMRKP